MEKYCWFSLHTKVAIQDRFGIAAQGKISAVSYGGIPRYNVTLPDVSIKTDIMEDQLRETHCE